MRRALRSRLPTLGSKYILITRRCSRRRYISQTAHHVLTLVRAFSPRIIHLSGDVDAIVQRTQQARGSAWTHQTTSFLNSQPYQLARGRTGIAGVGLFLQDMQKLLGEILQQPYALCCIDSTAGDRTHYQQTIMSYTITFLRQFRAQSRKV